MNSEEFRESLRKQDSKSLDDRVKRWEKLTPSTYKGDIPKLLFDYLTLSVDLYIIGHYIATVLFSASIIELILNDQVKCNNIVGYKKEMRLKNIARLCFDNNIIDQYQSDKINGIRELRNKIVHADASELNKIAKVKYKDWSIDIQEDLQGDLYLFPLGDTGIAKDALDYLTFTRNLSVKFYGVEE